MAFSNTYDTTNPGSAVSNREDLTDILTILAPQETPVLSSATKSKATATLQEWTVDSLASPATAGVAEGADVTSFADKFSGRARLGNLRSLKPKRKHPAKSSATSKLRFSRLTLRPQKTAQASLIL